MADENEKASKHAAELSKLGASKGGQARAEKLTKEERSGIARAAARARWGSGDGSVPKATHDGSFTIAGRLIACAVLETRKRVLTQETFLQAIGRAGKAKGGTGSERMVVDGLPPFLAAENLKPFISDELMQSTTPIVFRTLHGPKAFGYEAELLPKVCEVYLKARDAKALVTGQKHIAEACDLLMRGLATVGIIALVDEATGYQADRARDELNTILEAYIAKELLPWTKRFPDEFFRQIYRLHNWEYKPGTVRGPRYVGKLINKLIYEPLPPGVLSELKAKNPPNEKYQRKYKHHQFLTPDIGNPHLERQVIEVTALARVSDEKKGFFGLFDRAFPKKGQQIPLALEMAKDEKGSTS